MGLFDSVLGLAEDIADIALAPVEIVVDVTRTVTKPIAETAKEAAKTIKQEIKDV